MAAVKNLVTPEVRFSFVNIWKARLNDQGKAKYSLTLLFPLRSTLSGPALAEYDAFMALAKSECERVAAEKWGADKNKWPSGLRTPFRLQDDHVDKYEGYVKDAIFMNVSSDQKPQVVDENVVDIIDPAKVYSGCYGRASLRAFAYEAKGNKGVSFGLQNVQKLRDGESLAGRGAASADFQPLPQAAGVAPATNPTALFG